MAYTVKKISELSGVSIRTLHFYDEIGLLRPAYYGSNGYRYYEKEQLMRLQQILFFRELDFELGQIKKILGKGDFDQLVALTSHRKVLQRNLERTKKLIKTIDQTVDHLKGRTKMREKDLYAGFSKEKQEEYEKYLVERFGESAKKHITESRENMKNWTKADGERVKKEMDELCQNLVTLIEKGEKPSSLEAQDCVKRHLSWLKQFWTPNKESYAGHAQLIVDSELRKFYDAYHPDLATFLSEGIKFFVTTNCCL